MSKIWVTSDLHFCHSKNFLYVPRNFSSIEEHDNQIIKNWNSLIAPDDEVYCLGDCVLTDTEKGLRYMKMLNGKIHIAIGNHDTDKRIELYKQLDNVVEVAYGYRLKYKKKLFILTHYQTIVANFKEEKPIYNLHGHTHSKDKFCDICNCYNVALDAHNCFPVFIDDIIEDIKENKNASNSV